MNNRIDDNHNEKRAMFRIIGLLTLIIGAIFLIIGAVDFFSSATTTLSLGPIGDLTVNNGPHLFWCIFVGIILLFIGGVLTGVGFMGSALRYEAAEMAPVANDVINYMADGTKDSIETISKSIHKGISKEDNIELLICSSCSTSNSGDSKYCNNCGALLNKPLLCTSCGKENPINSKFCRICGLKL
jgi:ribosomal protein L40E